MAGENRTPEYLKINPQHTIPTMVDGDLALSESRAIMQYLVNQYAKGSSLYPDEPKARALVDEKLYFDATSLAVKFADFFYPQLFAGAPADKDKLAKLEDALGCLNMFLEGKKYSAGNQLTIADLALMPTVSNITLATDISKYSNITKWYDTVKSTAPGWEEAEGAGLLAFKGFVDYVKNKK